MKLHHFVLLALLFFVQGCKKPSGGHFTDPRDGQIYKTISFKNPSTGATITWMAQNLNYKMPGTFAYDGVDSHRAALGLLYTWEAAKKACPRGWHLPTDSEWSMLVNNFGGTDKAGTVMKSREGWDDNGNGTNSSGFDAPAGGLFRPDLGRIMFVGSLGYFWTSSAVKEGRGWSWNFHYAQAKVFRFDGNDSAGHSVRLVRD